MADRSNDGPERTPGDAPAATPAPDAPPPKPERQSPAPTAGVEHKAPSPAQSDSIDRGKNPWKAKLQASMGTVEWPFANKLLGELLSATCERSAAPQVLVEDVNAALAAMHGMTPKDEAEAMLVAQMLATHSAAMIALRRLKAAENIPQQDSNGNLAVKLLRTYAIQLEALARYRGKGQQTVRVEHVHVHSGGQAIVGAVATGGRGTDEIERQPHAIAHSPGETLSGTIEADREAVPIASR
jgi:hypothetical protein